MKRLVCIGALACLNVSAAFASAASVNPVSAVLTTDDAVNAMCPIGKEPIVPSAGTVQYKENSIALCCPSCGEAFLAWEESRKDSFVALAMVGNEPGQDQQGDDQSDATQPDASAGPSFAYPLDTCIVSGEKLDAMGEPIVKTYDGREARFCCGGCVKDFEKTPDVFWKKIDAEIVRTQLMHYPIDTCIVAGGKLGSMGDPVNYVHNNRLVRFCCAACEPKFKADPAGFFAELDKKITQKQVKAYPLGTCVVAGGELGSMGEPLNYIYNNRLVRFCCGGCIKGFEADPASHMAKIDAAYADAQRDSYPIDTCVVAGGKLGSMGDPVEVIAGAKLVRFCCKACLPAFQKEPAKYLEQLSTK